MYAKCSRVTVVDGSPVHDADCIARQGNASFTIHLIDDEFYFFVFVISFIEDNDVISLYASYSIGSESLEFTAFFGKVEVRIDACSKQKFVHNYLVARL